MTIAIGGIKVTSLEIILDDQGATKLNGNYNIITKNNVVLAKQSFSRYSDTIKLESNGTLGEIANKAISTAEKRIQTTLFGDEKL